MELRRALSIFRIKGRVPIEELNSAFRDLVKKYHPDKVRNHPQWAHERMAEINEAYETLAAWIATPPPASKTKQDPVDEREFSTNETAPDYRMPADDLVRPTVHPMPSSLSDVFYQAFNGFLDGLGLYFQYGLEKATNREEGVRRFRFKEALRQVETHRDELESLSKAANHPVVKAAARFARLTVADVVLGRPAFPGDTASKRFDSRLTSARLSFDNAIKEIFFPELIPDHLRGRAAGALYSCYSEFVLYMTVFTEGERRKAGILQAARYDAFMDLIELKNDGVLIF